MLCLIGYSAEEARLLLYFHCLLLLELDGRSQAALTLLRNYLFAGIGQCAQKRTLIVKCFGHWPMYTRFAQVRRTQIDAAAASGACQ